MLNKVMIIGNVGKEPELRFTPAGAAVTSFSVAVNNKYTNKDGEKKESVEWFNVVCWNKLAESCNQYLKKGNKVFVEGRQQSHSWEDKAGEKKYRVELVAGKVVFLDNKNSSSQEKQLEEEDIPF